MVTNMDDDGMRHSHAHRLPALAFAVDREPDGPIRTSGVDRHRVLGLVDQRRRIGRVTYEHGRRMSINGRMYTPVAD